MEEPRGRGGHLTYWIVFKNFLATLIPLAATALTLWLVWWYVVIHPQATAEGEAPAGLEQLGAPAVRHRSRLRPRPAATTFYVVFGIVAARPR